MERPSSAAKLDRACARHGFSASQSLRASPGAADAPVNPERFEPQARAASFRDARERLHMHSAGRSCKKNYLFFQTFPAPENARHHELLQARTQTRNQVVSRAKHKRGALFTSSPRPARLRQQNPHLLGSS